MISVSDTRLCHIDAIEEIEKQCFSVPWTREMLIKQLSDDMHIFLAALYAHRGAFAQGAGKKTELCDA